MSRHPYLPNPEPPPPPRLFWIAPAPPPCPPLPARPPEDLATAPGRLTQSKLEQRVAALETQVKDLVAALAAVQAEITAFRATPPHEAHDW